MSKRDGSPRLCEIANIMSDDEEPLLYRQLMAIKPAQMSNNKWLVTAGVGRSFFHDLKRNGQAHHRTIEKLVEAAGKTMAEFYAMDAPPSNAAAIREEVQSSQLPFRAEDEFRDVPVIGTALGHDLVFGEDGRQVFAEVTDLYLDEVQDYARRPAALKNRREVYVLTVVGSSMSHRYDPGDPVYVDPKQTARIGDDVVVYLRRAEGDGERVHSVLIKRLVKRTSTFVELQQLNPDAHFTINARDIAMVHRVIPYREMVLF